MSVKSFTGVLAKMWFGASLVALTASLNMTLAPEVLTAAHTVHVNGISNAKIVETVIPEPEPEPEPAVLVAQSAPIVRSERLSVASAPVVQAVATGPQTLVISGVKRSLTMQVDPGSTIWRTGKLYYGHNSPEILGGLKNLGVGDVLTIEGRNYRIMATKTYTKAELQDMPGVKNPDGNLMSDVTYNAYNAANGASYDVAVMTCAGRALGNGDATHRLVVYANPM